MLQFVEAVSVNEKVRDKIAQIEQKNRRLFTPKEKQIAFEMFMSGFFFSQQWNGEELSVRDKEADWLKALQF